MRTAIILTAAVVALGSGAQALALGRAEATVSATISQRAGIDVVSPLILPPVITSVSVPITPSVGGTPVGGTSVGGTAARGNAALTVRGQAGDTVSMAVPESFKVIRSGGTEALTVTTNTNGEYGLSGGGVVLGGTVMNGDTMSVNIGGAVSLASADRLVPGPYKGLLVVVVQYN